MDQALCHQGQGHLSQADVKVQGAGTFPAQVLIEAEELFDVPAIREVDGQGWYFQASPGAGEALEVIILGAFAGALNVTVAWIGQGAAPGLESFGGDGKAGPMRDEHLLGQSSVVLLEIFGMAQRDQQIKRGVLTNVVQQFHCEVLDIGNNERLLVLRAGQDLLSQLEQLLGGGTEEPSAAGVSEAKGLARFSIKKKEGLGLLGSRLIGAGASLRHVTFGVTDQAVRIQGQDLAGEVA